MSEVLKALGVNSYGFRARTRPVLFASLPLGFAAWAWTGSVISEASWVVGLAVAGGLPFLLGELAADHGRKLQEGLWRSWGGPPTLQLVKYSTSPLSRGTLQRIHEALARVCGRSLPSAQQEKTEADTADEVYLVCLDRARVIARDDPAKFAVVYEANVNYGYRRNLWAIKPWVLAAAMIGLLASLGHGIGFGWDVRNTGGVITAALVGLWCTAFLNPGFVKPAAFAYAERLLENVERMPQTAHGNPQAHGGEGAV